MSKANCSKCGAKTRKQHPVFAATLVQGGNEPGALVQFRNFVSVEINGTPTNFGPSQVVRLKYSIIAMLLNTPELDESLYFRQPAERFEYLMVHPEHEGKNI